MFGDTAGNFRPSGEITRAEVAAVLARTQLLDFPDLGATNTLPPGMTAFDAFGDVAEGQWYFYYIAWAYDAGLIQGYAGNFRPADPITREELAAIMARTGTLRTGTPTFTDADAISEWAVNYVYTVQREGWMRGDYGTGIFRPGDDIIRAEVATAVNRMLDRVDSNAALAAANLQNPAAARDFPDVDEDAWYFASVLAAANDHRFRVSGTTGHAVAKYIR